MELQSKNHSVSSMAGSGVTRDSNTRHSMADIGDTSEWTATSGIKLSRKRKAPEMELDAEELDQGLTGHFPDVTSDDICDLLDNQFVSGFADSFSQDAQPQVAPVDLDASLSHLTRIHAVSKTQNPADVPKATKSAAKDERPSKRQRVSGSGSLGSYVATALLGAMAGGLGTVALLASLPTDYFA